MNYLRAYCNLIRKAENRTPPKGYTEKHHIFPLSLYGENNRTVMLTLREHYIAHALLEKVCIKRYGLKDERTVKMIYAFWMMNNRENGYSNSNLYESARIKFYDNNIWVGRKHTKETKDKLREIGLNRSKEYKKRMSEVKKGKSKSEETKQKLREANLGKCYYERRGVPLSKEHKEKISDTLKGRKLSDETRAKMSAAKKQMSEETKQKMRESQRKRRMGTTPPVKE